jgi:hypothetical protein
MKQAKKIPKSLQPILWSRTVGALNLDKDKVYIIHQVLRFGTLAHIKWLFSVYSKTMVTKVFYGMPVKIYSPASLNFISTFILPSHEKRIKKTNYFAHTPRSITRA